MAVPSDDFGEESKPESSESPTLISAKAEYCAPKLPAKETETAETLGTSSSEFTSKNAEPTPEKTEPASEKTEPVRLSTAIPLLRPEGDAPSELPTDTVVGAALSEMFTADGSELTTSGNELTTDGDALTEAPDELQTANLEARCPQPRVYYPSAMQTNYTEGPLWGKYIPETNSFNVLPANTPLEHDEIGWIFSSCPFENHDCVHFLPAPKETSEETDETQTLDLAHLARLVNQSELVSEPPRFLPEYRNWAIWQADEPQLLAWPQGDKLCFVQFPEMKECEQDPYSLKLDVFSRNKGLLESDLMFHKGAVLIGCGSVGSLFGLELARAGVGRFLLLDDDILGYHNICRHQCGIPDVGRFKTDALRDRILQINPTAHVEVYHAPIQSVPLEVISKFADQDTIYIDGADNREGGLYASRLAKDTNSAFLSVGCWERAFAGEIFYSLPEADMASYEEFLKKTGTLSHRVNQNRIFYTTEQDLAKVTFEPGISVDMSFVTLVAVKLALDILNRNSTGYTTRVMDYLTQYTLVCNTNKKAIGGEMAGIFSYPLQVTHSIYIPRD